MFKFVLLVTTTDRNGLFTIGIQVCFRDWLPEAPAMRVR
jgi:hypothetical protein